MHSPGAFVRVLLGLLTGCACYRNAWEYDRLYHGDTRGFERIVLGLGEAPQQYRVLIVRAGWFLHQHLHLPLWDAFILFDVLSGAVAGLVLLELLERSAAYRRAPPSWRWIASLAYLFLLAYDLLWLEWYQRPETLPTACLLALILAVLSVRPDRTRTYALVATAVLSLGVLQACTRADIGFCVFAGFFVFACLPAGRRLPAPRAFYLTLCGGAALTSAATQWVLMRWIYPRATYGTTAVVQLLLNLESSSVLPFVLFLAPVVWTAWAVLRKGGVRRPEVEAAWLALLTGALLFVPLWAVVGRIQEVRIFLPFALCLAPLTAVCLAAQALGDAGTTSRRNTLPGRGDGPIRRPGPRSDLSVRP